MVPASVGVLTETRLSQPTTSRFIGLAEDAGVPGAENVLQGASPTHSGGIVPTGEGMGEGHRFVGAWMPEDMLETELGVAAP